MVRMPPEYQARHRRVLYQRGRAAEQTCVICEKQAAHWAHTHGTDPDDPQNYRPMCQSCHQRYDRSHRSDDSTCVNGHVRTEANTYINKRGFRVCRRCQADYQKAYYARKKKSD